MGTLITIMFVASVPFVGLMWAAIEDAIVERRRVRRNYR